MQIPVNQVRFDEELLELEEARNTLSTYNIWRKGYSHTPPNVKEVGTAIELAIGVLDDFIWIHRNCKIDSDIAKENTRLKAILARHKIPYKK